MSEHRPRRGFTLTELLIAIGIIVLLIGILLPVVTKVRTSAYGASTNAQISTLSLAIQQYYDDFRAYPGPLARTQLYQAINTTGSPPPTVPLIVTGGPTGFDNTTITGAQNLVLGLLGGLVFDPGAGNAIAYDPTQIFPSTSATPGSKIPGNAAAPVGAASLASLGTHQSTKAYIVPQPNDLYNPFDGAKLHPFFFSSSTQIAAKDSGIPVFLDKYPESMPILYMRANRGSAGMVGLNGQDGTPANLQDANGNPVSAQYDLVEVIGYTGSNIGLSNKAKINIHGLQKVWNTTNSPATYQISSNAAIDAWAYLRNPDLGPSLPASPPPSDIGVPRQKDGYILISAGPDRVYGTTDDITNFGAVAP